MGKLWNATLLGLESLQEIPLGTVFLGGGGSGEEVVSVLEQGLGKRTGGGGTPKKRSPDTV